MPPKRRPMSRVPKSKASNKDLNQIVADYNAGLNWEYKALGHQAIQGRTQTFRGLPSAMGFDAYDSQSSESEFSSEQDENAQWEDLNNYDAEGCSEIDFVSTEQPPHSGQTHETMPLEQADLADLELQEQGSPSLSAYELAKSRGYHHYNKQSHRINKWDIKPNNRRRKY